MMNSIEQLVSLFEQGKISRRELVVKFGALVVGLAGAGRLAEAADDKTEPTIRSHGLNHLALRVTNLSRSRDWYRKHFGLTVLREGARNCFMRTKDDFVALFQSDKPRMDHFCFTVSKADRPGAFDTLKAAGLDPWKVENRVYFHDPDGLQGQVAEENEWDDWG